MESKRRFTSIDSNVVIRLANLAAAPRESTTLFDHRDANIVVDKRTDHANPLLMN